MLYPEEMIDSNGRKWIRVEWPYTTMPERKTWRTKLRHARIYLNDEEHYPFTVEAGADSEYSYSGCLYGSKVADLDDAMRQCIASVKKQNRW